MNWLEVQPDKHPHTASRLVDGEAVIVLPEQGKVKVLNAVGSRIWELADGTRPVRDIADLIQQEYEVDHDQVREEVVAFVEQMVGDQLLTVESAA